MASTINLQVEQAVHDKQIDMKDFSVANARLKAFYKSNNCPRNHIINLSNIDSTEERKFIAEMVLAKIKLTGAKPENFQSQYVTRLRKVLSEYKNDGIEQYLLSIYKHKSVSYLYVAQFAKTFLELKRIGNAPIVNHVIYLKNIPIAKERLSRSISIIPFTKVNNSVNQKFLEDFAFAMLYQTDLSVSTIYHHIVNIYKIINNYSKDCLHWESSDIRSCLQNILKYNCKNRYKESLINSLTNFFNYLTDAGIIPDSKISIYAREISFPKIRKYIKTAPDEYVLVQIFNCLHKASPVTRLAYLILYCTGMRISELAMLQRDCLEWQGTQAYIHYYQFKMRKDVCNAIPLSLADLITKHIKDSQDENKFLFLNNKNKPYTPNSIGRKIKNFFVKMNVCYKDGTVYNFTPHSYRHLMAKRMRQQGIPIRFIQEQLHHYSPDMTLFYVEHFDDDRIQEISEWLKKNNATPNTNDVKLEIDRKKLIAASILPNGLCMRLPVLGPCKSCNNCIDCPNFKTSIEWEPVLVEQREQLEKFIAHAKKQGWDKAVNNNEKTLSRLTEIIEKIRSDANEKLISLPTPPVSF